MYHASEGAANLRSLRDSLQAEITMAARKSARSATPREVERIQSGVRLEKRLLKVLKGLAEYLDVSLGDLIEGIALHALENKTPFKASTLDKATQLKRVYGLDLVAADSHRLRDPGDPASSQPTRT